MIGSFSFLQVTRTSIAWMSSNFDGIPPLTSELAASEKSNNKLVSTLAPSFLIGSSSFLQVTRTTIKAWMSSNLGGIPPLTSELAALEHLKNQTICLLAL